jgi:hypothetical protein
MVRSISLIALPLMALAGPMACKTSIDPPPYQDNQTATTHLTSAEVERNDRIAAAERDFDITRDDFHAKAAVDLDDLDSDINDVTAKAKELRGQARAEMDARLIQIRAQRDALRADVESLETSTAASWEDATKRVDDEMARLKGLINGS